MSDAGSSRLVACITADTGTFCVVSLAKHKPGMHKVFFRLDLNLTYSQMFIRPGCGGYSHFRSGGMSSLHVL